jgi:hypothetical protein
MSTTDKSINNEDATQASKDYDPGADTAKSEHTTEDNEFFVRSRFNESPRYDSQYSNLSGDFLDSDEEW